MSTTVTAPGVTAPANPIGDPMDLVARTRSHTTLQETVSQTMSMAWRATKKMRRNAE
jgi:ABC-2 type transport system permease protein